MSLTTYADVLTANIRGARGRMQITQSALADRMRALGFQWEQQTVGMVEKGKRRVTAEEILGLALALETTIGRLMGAREEDGPIALPGGMLLAADSVECLAGCGVNDHAVAWDGDRG